MSSLGSSTQGLGGFGVLRVPEQPGLVKANSGGLWGVIGGL